MTDSAVITDFKLQIAKHQLEQTYFEKMKLAHEADVQQKKSPLQLRSMRLGVAYSLFDGLELLEQSIRSISSEVDFVVVVFHNQGISGLSSPGTLISTLQRLCKLGLIDELVPYTPRTFSAADKKRTVSVRATSADLGRFKPEQLQDQFMNEVSKREIGRQRCMAHGCTHFMPLNCDEFYTSDQLQQAKRKMVAEDLDGLLCKTRVYFKSPSCELLPQDDRTHVPLMYKVAEWMPFKIAVPYFGYKNIDPCRTLENLRRLGEAGRAEVTAHHLAFVRTVPDGLKCKFANPINKSIFDTKFEDFFPRFLRWSPDAQSPAPLPQQSDRARFTHARKVDNLFEVKI